MILFKGKSFKCDDETWNELDKLCKILKTTKSAFIRMAIMEKIQKCQIKGENTK